MGRSKWGLLARRGGLRLGRGYADRGATQDRHRAQSDEAAAHRIRK